MSMGHVPYTSKDWLYLSLGMGSAFYLTALPLVGSHFMVPPHVVAAWPPPEHLGASRYRDNSFLVVLALGHVVGLGSHTHSWPCGQDDRLLWWAVLVMSPLCRFRQGQGKSVISIRNIHWDGVRCVVKRKWRVVFNRRENRWWVDKKNAWVLLNP